MGIPVARQDTITAALCLSLPITVLTDRTATLTTGWSAIGTASYLAYPAICRQGAIAARPALRVFQVTPEATRLILTEKGAAKVLSTTLGRIRHAGADLVLARDDRLRPYPARPSPLVDQLIQPSLLPVRCRSGGGRPDAGQVAPRQTAVQKSSARSIS